MTRSVNTHSHELLNKREAAQVWMEAHPEAMTLFLSMAVQAARKKRRFGIGFLTERIRWEFSIMRDDDDFKINNNHRAYIARELVRREPWLKAHIEFRHVQESA